MYDKLELNSYMKFVNEARMLFFSCFFFYLFLRKKIKVLLFMAMAFLVFSIVSYAVPSITQGIRMLVLIGLFMLVLVLSFRELKSLEGSGKTAHEIFKPDKVDYIVFVLFVIAWMILRFFVFNK